jgi:hypothetical protein
MLTSKVPIHEVPNREVSIRKGSGKWIFEGVLNSKVLNREVLICEVPKVLESEESRFGVS